MPQRNELASITTDPRVLKRLHSHGVPDSPLIPVTCRGKPAALAFLPAGVALAYSGHLSAHRYTPFHDAHLEGSGSERTLRAYGFRDIISFADSDAADECAALLDVYKAKHPQRYTTTRPGLQVAQDERLVLRCTYLGGAFLPLQVREQYDLVARAESLDVFLHPALNDSTPLYSFAYGSSTNVQIGGPGSVTRGGGWFGGGIGLQGAAEGMLIASVMNSLTTKTSITTVITIADKSAEGFFLNTAMTPDDLRRHLSILYVRLRGRQSQETRERAIPANDQARTDDRSVDLITQLERLNALRDTGALTADEFSAAKAAILK